MTDFLILIVFPALLVFFIDYLIGRPSDEKFSINDIFSGYTFLLSRLRLHRMGVLQVLKIQLSSQLSAAKTKKEIADIQISFRRMVIETARPYFSWEKAAGMCPVCFHVWIFVANYLYQTEKIFFSFENIITFTFNLTISHLIIRVLKKFI